MKIALAVRDRTKEVSTIVENTPTHKAYSPLLLDAKNETAKKLDYNNLMNHPEHSMTIFNYLRRASSLFYIATFLVGVGLAADTNTFAIIGNTIDSDNLRYIDANPISKITIDGKCTNLNLFPFQTFYNLKEITVDKRNPVFAIVDGALIDKTTQKLIKFPCQKTDKPNYIIPKRIKEIQSEAFFNSQITNIIIPASVEKLESHTFTGCANLKSALFLGDAPTMGEKVFDHRGYADDQIKIKYNGGKGFTSPIWKPNPIDSYIAEDVSSALTPVDKTIIHTNFPVGIWNNNGGEAGLVTLGFRADGKGTYLTGSSFLPTQWRLESNSSVAFHVIDAGKTNYQELEFIGSGNVPSAIWKPNPIDSCKAIEKESFQTNGRTMGFSIPFNLISTQEPPDLLALKKQGGDAYTKVEEKYISKESIYTNFPVGIWNNNAEGFGVVIFGFRKDGKGTFAGGVMTLPTTWKLESNKVIISVEGVGLLAQTNFPQIDFVRSGNTTAIGNIPNPSINTNSQNFKLISLQEPPDILAELKKQQEEAQRKADEKFNNTSNNYTSTSDLKSAIYQFYESGKKAGIASLNLNNQTWLTGIQISTMADGENIKSFIYVRTLASLPTPLP